MKKFIYCLLLAITIFVNANSVYARSSSRSSSSRSSGSSWGSSTKTTTTKSNSIWSSSKTKAPSEKPTVKKTPTYSKTDSAAMAKAKTNGTNYKTKTEAQTVFKQKYASTYTSTYATQPTTRPSHIPQTTKIGDKNVNITYNVNRGGYGYMSPSGSWIMYDAMSDVAMMSMLMRQNSYAYDGMYIPTGHNVVRVNHHMPNHYNSNDGIIILWVLLFTVVFCFVAWIVCKK